MPRSGTAGEPRSPLDKLEKDIEVEWLAAAVRRCRDSRSVSSIYGRIVRGGYAGSVYLGNLVVQMHGKCGELQQARYVFDRIRNKNLFTWNIMISAYARGGYPLEAIELYRKMDIPPNGMTFASALSACSAVGDLKQGQEIHASVLASGIEPSVILESALVNMYARCGRIDIAKESFDRIPQKSVASWNTLIAAYAHLGHTREALEIFERMVSQGVQPDRVTFISVLNACDKLQVLSEIHRKILSTGLDSDLVVSTSLVNMYAKCGSLETARGVFDKMSNKNVISWNSMLTAYVQSGLEKESCLLFREMDLEGGQPDPITFATVLGACGSIEEGELIHSHSEHLRSKLSEHGATVIQTALLRMYARFGRLERARNIFDKMKNRDLVAWNSILTALMQAGEWNQTIEVFSWMMNSGALKGDKTTLTCVLSACSSLGNLEAGREIHEKFVRSTELEQDLGVQNALLNLHAKCGSIEFAREFFDRMRERDEVSMNVMITGYAQQGQPEEAIRLFREMDLLGMQPDDTTFASAVIACSSSGALKLGKRIHERILASGKKLLPNLVLETALVTMYGKCGTLEQAKQVFDQMREKNLISWNSMLGACAHQGGACEAVETLRLAAAEGIELDPTSFTSVLIACSHAGDLQRAYECFLLMLSDFEVSPAAENYRCMVDLLARSGKLADAEELMHAMPFSPDAVSWRTFLAACRVQGSLERVGAVAEEAFKLDPENTAPYVLLSSIYSAAGKRDEYAELRSSMKERMIRKMVAGKSSIEIRNRVHEFVAGDTSHPQIEAILAELGELNLEMKRLGFVPSVAEVAHDVRDEEKEVMLGLHSEKLAVAFGLISTRSGTPLLVMKNLRICSDCHAAMKMISRIKEREITVRDVNRFHRFQQGFCSCGDYW